jgi:hypothetical protein
MQVANEKARSRIAEPELLDLILAVIPMKRIGTSSLRSSAYEGFCPPLREWK